MSRLSYVDTTDLDAEQQALFASIVGGPRAGKRKSLVDENGHLTGVFNAFLHLPAVGRHWSAVGEALRFNGALDRRLFELSVLTIAAHWKSGHEWTAHVELARQAGISDVIIDAVLHREKPVFVRDDEAAVHGFVSELVAQQHVSPASYKAARTALGETQLVELASVVAYYVALAAMMNAFDVHPPKDFTDPWPSTDN